MEITPTSIKSISFEKEGETYKVSLEDSSLHYHKNDELISVREVSPEFNSIDLYKSVKKLINKLGINSSKLKLSKI